MEPTIRATDEPDPDVPDPRGLDPHGPDPHGGRPDPAALIASHLGLVAQVVNRTTARFPSYVDRDDLRSAGCVGLVEAARRYDATAGVPFARYAQIRIRGSVLDASRARDWAPRRLRRDLRAIDHATSVLVHRLQRRPSDGEVAEGLGVSAEVVRGRLTAAVSASLLALDGPDPEVSGAGVLADRLEERDASWLPEAAFEQAELSETLRTAIEHLPDTLRHVLVEHHLEGRLLRDLAHELGCTEARVSQLGFEALHALRAYFATLYPDVAPVPATAPGKLRRARFVAEVTAAGRRAAHGSRPDATPLTRRAGCAGRRPSVAGGGATP